MKNTKINIPSPEVTSDEIQKVRKKLTIECSIPEEDKDKDNSVKRDQLVDEKVADLQANRELRDKYSFKAFKVVKKSLWGWAILLFIYGVIKFLTRHENGGFEVFSDQVLIAITSATTLNIFAAFLSLIRGLFPSIKENKKGK